VGGDVHEGEIFGADELDGWTLEESVELVGDEAGGVDGLLGDLIDVGVGTNDADVVLVGVELVEGDVLADEDANADARHVEAIEKVLDRDVDVARLGVLALVLEDALSDGSDDRIMALLDIGQEFCETLVVVVHFWRPSDVLPRRDKVPGIGSGLSRIDMIYTHRCSDAVCRLPFGPLPSPP
jgi:hypothetical protein